ncbi:MAG: YbjN domain-containing protein [Myxococcota bacterium]
MNPAEVASALLIEDTLKGSPAFKQVDDKLYVVKQGSAYVMVNIVPWDEDSKALVRCVAVVAKDIVLEGKLALELMERNAYLRFGAFGYDPVGKQIMFIHSILGGTTLDPEELLATLRDVALIADEYDDKLVDKYGGQRMQDALEEAAMERIFEENPELFRFDDE